MGEHDDMIPEESKVSTNDGSSQPPSEKLRDDGVQPQRTEMNEELRERLVDMSPRVVDAVPSNEPRCPDYGWKYRVSRPYIAPGALDNVTRCIDIGLVSSATQPVVDLEQELRRFYQVPVARACNSGYSALVVCLQLAKIGVGDEVVIPSLTMIAVANAAVAVGGRVVFADNAPGRLNPGLAEYSARLTERTKAIIVTYTYGTTVDLLGLREMCDSRNIVLIEDISEAIGTVCQRQLAGTVGHYAAASLYANKLVTAGDGGFVLSTVADNTYERARSYTNHAFVPKYHFVHFERSGNYKMAGLAAALVSPAIAHIPELTQHRQFVAQKYREYLRDVPGVTLMEESEFGPDAPWVFGVVCDTRHIKDHIRQYMAQHGSIETRDYFFPIHLQPAYQESGIEPPHLSECERMGRCGVYLPTHYYLTDTDIRYISESLRQGALTYTAEAINV